MGRLGRVGVGVGGDGGVQVLSWFGHNGMMDWITIRMEGSRGTEH